MENEYKFVSKFIEGKTYQELTDEELEKLKSGVGVKKEDKEYIDSLLNNMSEINENNIVKDNTETEENVNEESNETENIKEDVVENTPDKIESNSKKGVKVTRAFGRVLILEDKRVIELTKAELKEKAFWCKGDVYYG